MADYQVLDDEGELAYILQHAVDVTGLRQEIRAEENASDLVVTRAQVEQGVFRRAAAVQESAWALASEYRHLRRLFDQAEAIGKLTGGVAHDFNNLLQIISANLQFLHRTLAHSPETQQRIDTASEAVQRGAELTSQLLTFARRQPLAPRIIDPARMLGEMGDLIRRTLDSTIELEVHVEDGLWNTVVDPHRLENVILNLVINARDAMEGEGRLTIELENTRLDEAYAETRRGHARPLRLLGRLGYGPRHERGGAGARLRALFHHQG